jgi:hypothetical protein
VFKGINYIFISAALVGIIFRFGKFTGNDSFRNEMASPLLRFSVLNWLQFLDLLIFHSSKVRQASV